MSQGPAERAADGQLGTMNYQSLKLKTKLNNERLKESLEALKRQSQEGKFEKRLEERARGQYGALSAKKNGRAERPRNGAKRRETLASQESLDAPLSAISKNEANEKGSQRDLKAFGQINLDKLEGEHDKLRDLLLTTQGRGFQQKH